MCTDSIWLCVSFSKVCEVDKLNLTGVIFIYAHWWLTVHANAHLPCIYTQQIQNSSPNKVMAMRYISGC